MRETIESDNDLEIYIILTIWQEVTIQVMYWYLDMVQHPIKM